MTELKTMLSSEYETVQLDWKSENTKPLFCNNDIYIENPPCVGTTEFV